MTAWNNLNDSEKAYLKAIFMVEQDKERRTIRKTGYYYHLYKDEWRWINYHRMDSETQSLLQTIIIQTNPILAGNTSMNIMEALNARSLIEYKTTRDKDASVLWVRLTQKGRKLVRAATAR